MSLSLSDMYSYDSAAALRSVIAAPTYPFLVYTDEYGKAAPTIKHRTREVAEKEARRLADANPGTAYYVLGSVSYSRREPSPPAKTRSMTY
jgi:hypothetical protein